MIFTEIKKMEMLFSCEISLHNVKQKILGTELSNEAIQEIASYN